MSDVVANFEGLCNQMKSEIQVFQKELEELPGQMKAAGVIPDVAEIKRLKARESALHELLLDSAAKSRIALQKRTQEVVDALTANAKDATEAVAKLKAERESLIRAHEQRLVDFAKEIGALENKVRLAVDEVGNVAELNLNLHRELTSVIETSSDLVAA